MLYIYLNSTTSNHLNFRKIYFSGLSSRYIRSVILNFKVLISNLNLANPKTYTQQIYIRFKYPFKYWHFLYMWL